MLGPKLTKVMSATAGAPTSVVCLRVRREDILEADPYLESDSSLPSRNHDPKASATRLNIFGARIVKTRDDLILGGGTNGEKFVLGLIDATCENVRALCNELREKADARDVAAAIKAFAEREGVKRSEIHTAVDTNQTKVKELYGLTRILPTVSEVIDGSDHWPSHENLVYVSRGETEADQAARWKEILHDETRSAKSRRARSKQVPRDDTATPNADNASKSRAALLEEIVAVFEQQNQAIETLNLLLRDGTPSEEEKALLNRCKIVVRRLSETVQQSGATRARRGWRGHLKWRNRTRDARPSAPSPTPPGEHN